MIYSELLGKIFTTDQVTKIIGPIIESEKKHSDNWLFKPGQEVQYGYIFDVAGEENNIIIDGIIITRNTEKCNENNVEYLLAINVINTILQNGSVTRLWCVVSTNTAIIDGNTASSPGKPVLLNLFNGVERKENINTTNVILFPSVKKE